MQPRPFLRPRRSACSAGVSPTISATRGGTKLFFFVSEWTRFCGKFVSDNRALLGLQSQAEDLNPPSLRFDIDQRN
jgi:hypothetical protein